MRSLLLALISLLAISTAYAEDTSMGCAPVEGTWYNSYIINRFGVPERIHYAPGDKPLMAIQVKKRKITLTMRNGKRTIFSEKRYVQSNDYNAAGFDDHDRRIDLTTEDMYIKNYIKSMIDDDAEFYNQTKPCLMLVIMDTDHNSVTLRMFERKK